MPIDESLIEEMAREFFNGQYPYVKVVARLEAIGHDWFFPREALFAKVTEKYIAHLTRRTKRENRKSLLSRWPKALYVSDEVKYINWSFGRHTVSITKRRGGWTVERAADCSGHFDLLTTTLGDFTVLFSSLRKAIAVLETFLPDPPPGMIWNAGVLSA